MAAFYWLRRFIFAFLDNKLITFFQIDVQCLHWVLSPMSAVGKRLCFVNHVYRAYLDHYLSDICIENIRLMCRINCTVSRTKNHAQNKSAISDLHIGQIYRSKKKKNYKPTGTFCDTGTLGTSCKPGTSWYVR